MRVKSQMECNVQLISDMGCNQLYSLSWGEFGSSLASTVQVLRGHGDLVDVTLTAGGKIFPAHKLVLGAASPLLMELLKVSIKWVSLFNMFYEYYLVANESRSTNREYRLLD